MKKKLQLTLQKYQDHSTNTMSKCRPKKKGQPGRSGQILRKVQD